MRDYITPYVVNFLLVLEIGSNVEYVELSIPLDLPLSFRKFIPNTFYAVHTDPKDGR